VSPQQLVTDADGKTTRWPDQNEDYVIQKFKLRERRMWTSPYGKPIQAPWDYSAGCMRKAPKVADFGNYLRKNMLEKSGTLKSSIVAKKSFARGKIQFAITIKGAARKYGWANHYGDKNRWERFKYRTLRNGEIVERIGTPEKYALPARPFMVWTARDINKLIETLYAWLENRFKK
jgi:phage gpG-like protein